jgi:hypothetical protein
VITLSWNAKYHLYYIYFEIPKDLPLYFSWNLRHVDFLKNSRIIYNKLLFRLYASVYCVTSQFVLTPLAPFCAEHSDARAYATSRSSPRHTDRHHTFYKRWGCSWFSYLANTYDGFVSLWMVSVVNVSPLVDSVGPQMNLASLVKHHWPWYSPRVIKFRTRISRNFYVSFFHHMTRAIIGIENSYV